MSRKCSVEGCDRKHSARGFCKTHYTRWRRTGDPQKGRSTVCTDFIKAAIEANTDDCIEWPFARCRDGYGRITTMAHGNTPASRVVCEMVYGPPSAPKLQAAHSCHNPPCINPRHLRWATQTENLADSKEAA